MNATFTPNVLEAPFQVRATHPSELRRMEADHRIANSLQIAASILRGEIRRIADPETARAAIEAAAARLDAIARLHRTLSEVSPHGNVALDAHLAPICAEITRAVGTSLAIDTGPVTLPASVATEIGMVVSEMATNAAKHACRDGAPPVLTVEADRNGYGEVRLRLYDDGPGFPDGFRLEAERGLGTVIIRSIVGRIGGRVQVMARSGPLCAAGAGLEIVLPPQGPRSA